MRFRAQSLAFPRSTELFEHGRGIERRPTAYTQKSARDDKMQRMFLTASVSALLAGVAAPASANQELLKMQQDPKQWVMQTGDYSNQRFSKLKQITADNVGKLQVAWTFSTGVLRGHEGGPLVIGDVMYVHTPFPNTVYALDLNDDGKILWKYEPKQDPNVIPVMCCDTVNRGVAYARRQDLPASGRHHARRARRQDRQRGLVGQERRSGQGRDRHRLRRSSSRTRSTSAFPAANSAFAASSPPTTSETASLSGAAIRLAPTTTR